MLSEDIVIAANGVWVEIPLTSAMSIIHNKGVHDIMMRMGAASTSDGMIVSVGQTVVVDETCYVRSQKTSTYNVTLVVTR